MQVDEFSRWSEPLTTSLLRIVSADVDNLLQGVVVVVFPYEPFVRDQVKYRLVGDVNRFEADHLGRIVLEIQWGVADTDGEVVVPVRRNRYQAQALIAGRSQRRGGGDERCAGSIQPRYRRQAGSCPAELRPGFALPCENPWLWFIVSSAVVPGNKILVT